MSTRLTKQTAGEGVRAIMREGTTPICLIDLLSERHLEVRTKLHEQDGQEISRTEAHVLAVLRTSGRQTVSELGRIIRISRQGTHKCIQGLLERGLVEPDPNGGAIRDKPVMLTARGREAAERLENAKLRLEDMLAERIGRERVELLRQLLREEWFPGGDGEA